MAEQWHAGRTVGRTLYRGDGPDDCIGLMDSRALADLVVVAVNISRVLLAKLDESQRGGSGTVCLDADSETHQILRDVFARAELARRGEQG